MKKLLVLVAVLGFFFVVKPCQADEPSDIIRELLKPMAEYSDESKFKAIKRAFELQLSIDSCIVSEVKDLRKKLNEIASSGQLQAEQILNCENQKNSQFVKINGFLVNKQYVVWIVIEVRNDGKRLVRVRLNLKDDSILSDGFVYETHEEAEAARQKLAKECGLK